MFLKKHRQLACLQQGFVFAKSCMREDRRQVQLPGSDFSLLFIISKICVLNCARNCLELSYYCAPTYLWSNLCQCQMLSSNKRKNKTANVSGERSQKIHVSNPQPSTILLHNKRRIPRPIQQLFIKTVMLPQGPQSQFAEFLSPIPGQKQQQQPQI